MSHITEIQTIKLLVVALLFAVILLTAICRFQYSKGYHKGKRKGLHDGWVLAQGGKISPGLTPLEAWEMPMVHPDGTVYRDGKLEKEE